MKQHKTGRLTRWFRRSNVLFVDTPNTLPGRWRWSDWSTQKKAGVSPLYQYILFVSIITKHTLENVRYLNLVFQYHRQTLNLHIVLYVSTLCYMSPHCVICLHVVLYVSTLCYMSPCCVICLHIVLHAAISGKYYLQLFCTNIIK